MNEYVNKKNYIESHVQKFPSYTGLVFLLQLFNKKLMKKVFVHEMKIILEALFYKNKPLVVVKENRLRVLQFS